jgi:hypothetical protein
VYGSVGGGSCSRLLVTALSSVIEDHQGCKGQGKGSTFLYGAVWTLSSKGRVRMPEHKSISETPIWWTLRARCGVEKAGAGSTLAGKVLARMVQGKVWA